MSIGDHCVDHCLAGLLSELGSLGSQLCYKRSESPLSFCRLVHLVEQTDMQRPFCADELSGKHQVFGRGGGPMSLTTRSKEAVG
jgi:hypothetical protein